MSKNKKILIKIIISTFILIIGIIVKIIWPKLEIVHSLIFLLSYLVVGFKVLKKMFRNIIRGQVFDENFLMSIASIGAFIIGEYLESVMVMLLYQVGELFESYAVGKSRKSIASLMNIKPIIAHIIKDDNEIEDIDPKKLKIGDIIQVKVGEKIPVDGVIIKGNTIVDTSMLTGESLPKELVENDQVLSGSINNGSVITVKATTNYENSTVTKILELVQNASSRKTKTENFITVFARYYTPIVVILALLLAIIPSIITKDYINWIYRALNFLVVSCPCALVISVPLGFFSGIGRASKSGILIKGSSYFELINRSKYFIFDKTGTLTKGNLVVDKFHNTKTKEELLFAAYITEKNSNHPIAKSIISFIENEIKIENTLNLDINEISGKGMVVKKENDVYLAGNDKLMEEYKIDYQKEDNHQTLVHIARNNQYLGYFSIVDEIKQNSQEVIKQLTKSKATTIMLTGDNHVVAKEVSEKLGLTKYYSELLPNQKYEKLEEIIANKKAKESVVYIGDGINDAPVLMRADIGISMGQIGSDSAIEASDIVLMNDNLENIIIARNIAKKTIRIVKQNIIFALTVKIAILIYSVFVPNPQMWLAIFADVGVSIIAICNSLRIMYSKKLRK